MSVYLALLVLVLNNGTVEYVNSEQVYTTQERCYQKAHYLGSIARSVYEDKLSTIHYACLTIEDTRGL